MTATLTAIQPHFRAEGGANDDIVWSLDLENALLGSVLIWQSALHDLPPDLAPEHFFLPANAAVFAAMLELDRRGIPPDIRMVAEEIERRGQMDLIQSPMYLTALWNIENSPYHAKHYGNAVLRLARERRIADAKAKVDDCLSGSDQLPDLLNSLRDALADNQDSGGFTSIEEGLTELNEHLDQRAAGVEIGVRSGFSDLDRKMGLWQAGDLIVLAALTSAGKSSWVLNVILNQIRRALRVALFSMEMNQEQVAVRLVALASGIPAIVITSGDMTPEQWQRYSEVQGFLSTLPLRLDAKHIPSVEEMRRQLLVEHRASPFGLVVVDLLGSVRGTGKDRVQEVSSITNGLKALAREMNVPILACQQVSRRANESGKIELHHLKDSGTIEQVASTVLLLTPPKQAGTTAEKSTAYIEIAKNRHGEKGTVPLFFHWPTMKFGDIARTDYGSAR